MELNLATAEKEVLEELVKTVQGRGWRGESGVWEEFLAVYDKKIGSPNDPSMRSRGDLVAFLRTFKEKRVLQILQSYTHYLLIKKLRQESPDNDTPEQNLIRLTTNNPKYSIDYSFQPYSEEWLVSDVGLKTSKVMKSREMLAVDCEMVLCEGGTEGLVKVGIVDRDLKVIFNHFVKPSKPVVDYRTAITGVAAKDIENATLSVVDIQKKLQPFLSDGFILVGHSLNKDLQVLKIDHPKVIDTSLVFKYTNAREGQRPSLNNLSKSILGYEVREAGVSHDCINDATCAMKLALALIEKRVEATISPSEEMLEFERSRLFLHRIPHSVPHEDLNQFLSGEFTLDVKPARYQSDYYCAFAVFNSSKEAEQAFEDVDRDIMMDSSGLPQKEIFFDLSSGSGSGSCVSFYVRKMVQHQ